MKAIIVDDESRSRRTLQALCNEYCTDLEIVGMAASVQEARYLLAEHDPNIVFLDIEMPIENGFALLDTDGPKNYEVIFTTAYDQYALQAFKFSAVDYLLKPIEIDELIKAVDKTRTRLNLGDNSEKFAFLKEILASKEINKIALTTMDGYIFVDYNTIIRCEADNNYTFVYFKEGGKLTLTKTLKHYDEILEPKGFFRVHRSHLINIKYVRKFLRGKQSFVEMTDGEVIEVSARKKDSLLEELS